jgi:sulfonate transport system ATP-binding protein
MAAEHPLPVATTVAALSGVGRSYGDRLVLDSVDLRIGAGEFVALVGRSGGGKSTLLRILAGLDSAATGHVHAPAAVGVVFQEPRLLPWKRVWRNVALGLTGADARTQAMEALAEVGLTDHATAWPLTLSGGEAQRVALARALVRAPDLLLLDEPFGALDALTRLSMHRLVTELWQARRPAVLLVTHDVDEALLLADRVLVLSDHRITTDLDIDSVVGVERPRSRGDERLLALRADLLADLGASTQERAL